MTTPHRYWPLALMACLLCGGATAQTRIASVPQPAGPSTAARSSFALPNAAGLVSASGATAGTDVPVTPASTTTGGIANPNTNAATSVGSTVVAGTNGRFAEADIARSFLEADVDHNGELTRDEAARLSIAPASFQAMDRDGNGVITRFEYHYATH